MAADRIFYQCRIHGLLEYAIESRGVPPRCPVCRRAVVLRVKS